MKNIIKRTSAALLAAITITACTSSSVYAFSIPSLDIISKDTSNNLTIPLNGDPVTLERGRTYTLPQINSFLFPGYKYQLSTTNNKVVSIKNGVITANGTGICTLKITLPNGMSISKNINVALPKVTVKFEKSNMTIGKGEAAKLKAMLSSGNGNITWSSSNNKVVSVDSTGKLTGKSSGTATITAKLANGEKASCKVTVKTAPKSVILTKNKITLGIGESKELDFTINGNAASYNVNFSSSNPSVVSVDSKSGKLITKRTGKAVVTVKTYNGKTAKCTVEVKKAPASLVLNTKNVTLRKGGKISLKATIPNGSASEITFYPSNSRIISVDSNGLVKALQTGTAFVTAKTYNGKSVTCKVTVTA